MDITGYSLEQLKETNVFQLIDERFRNKSMQRFKKHVSGESRPGLNEIIITTKDGKSIPAEVNSNVIVSDDEIMVLSTIRDISFRKQIENENSMQRLRQRNANANAFQKISTMTWDLLSQRLTCTCKHSIKRRRIKARRKFWISFLTLLTHR